MIQRLTGNARAPVRLAREISSGGEGSVHEIRGAPGRVAKVWHPTHRSPERSAKLRAMRRIQPRLTTTSGLPLLAWPDEILYQRTEIVGYCMPKVGNAIPLFDCLSPRSRQKSGVNMTPSDLALLAQRIAWIFDALHHNQCYIGDVNDQNILIHRGSLVPIIIDSDSFQIRNPANPNQPFLSRVGMPDYQPPERNNMNQPINASTDAFGLAVITYKLLLENEHPFLGIDPNDEPNPPTGLEERIQSGRFAHARQRNWQPRPKARGLWNGLPAQIRKTLIKALDYHQHGTDRPSAQEMMDALENLAAPARSNPTPQPQQTRPRPRQQPQQTRPRPRPQTPPTPRNAGICNGIGSGF